MTHLLPMADEPAPERADAARNREAILAAALRLVETPEPELAAGTARSTA